MTIMNKFDFNGYKNLKDIIGYDGFIDRDGLFYKVKVRHSYDINCSHINWAEQYINQDMKKLKTILTPSYSMIYTLSKMRDKQDILIQIFGFVYYSHDHLTNEPIIITPDPIYNDKKITDEQLDTLYKIMEYNMEKPLEHEVFLNPYYYKKYR